MRPFCKHTKCNNTFHVGDTHFGWLRNANVQLILQKRTTAAIHRAYLLYFRSSFSEKGRIRENKLYVRSSWFGSPNRHPSHSENRANDGAWKDSFYVKEKRCSALHLVVVCIVILIPLRGCVFSKMAELTGYSPLRSETAKLSFRRSCSDEPYGSHPVAETCVSNGGADGIRTRGLLRDRQAC